MDLCKGTVYYYEMILMFIKAKYDYERESPECTKQMKTCNATNLSVEEMHLFQK